MTRAGDFVKVEAIQKKLVDEMKQYKLWYEKPAPYTEAGWQNEVLPIGSGRLGMCIYGIPSCEHLQFNEKSLWTGGPAAKRPDYNGGNIENSAQHLTHIREALEQGNQKAVLKHKSGLVGIEEGYGAYQNFGEVVLDFGHTQVQAYQRALDITNAVCTVSYTADGVRYTREHFASFAPRVLVTRVTADTEKALNFSISLAIAQAGCQIAASENSLRAQGALEDNGLQYLAKLNTFTDGKVQDKENMLYIKDASYCEIVLTAGTDYKNEYPSYRGELPVRKVNKALCDYAALGFERVKEKSITYYRSLFDRLALDLDGKAAEITTDALVRRFQNNPHNETALYYEELLFQYGRYLLIASSAEDDILPANLQGVWNNSNQPAWGCDYHLNVNLQMCYWHAYVANLAELAKPMIAYMNSLRAPGRVTAACYHGIKSDAQNPENGWVCHTQNTPFGWTCPGWSFYWGWSPAASSWMMQNCWDYYAFTKDDTYLRDSIYPMMKENAKFWLQNLVYNQGQNRYVSSPSFSPEHGPISIGNTYEQTLVWQLFDDTQQGAELLGDTDFAKRLCEVKEKLLPVSIGKWGQIKEWYEEDSWYKKNSFLRKSSYKKHGCQYHHRHASHLLGLYPCAYIRAETPELLEACRVSLADRGVGLGAGGNNSGWGKANRINLWARAKAGEEAYKNIESLLAGNIAPNLWDMHPPFQMDGNCGYTSGVCEMLCYSNASYIELLPALPSAWQNGCVKGICARGGYVLDMAWQNKAVTQYTVYSETPQQVTVKVNGKIETVKTVQLPQSGR